MGELLTDHIFGTGLACMKTALEDFFSWVDLLVDWHKEPHQSPLHHLGNLRRILSQTNDFHSRDQERLEASSLELAESEHLLRRYRGTPPSFVTFCAATSRRHLQESIVHTLQKRQHFMADEIQHLEEAID
ncbi:hypothetical protein LIER_19404 [Lithospermum erythrorhizon]|uniref:Uncharacterized protein n=1 Tax=Lithospermum erythrorhizon TaxID=34254 RepID=A0AAV3QHP1_LITER